MSPLTPSPVKWRKHSRLSSVLSFCSGGAISCSCQKAKGRSLITEPQELEVKRWISSSNPSMRCEDTCTATVCATWSVNKELQLTELSIQPLPVPLMPPRKLWKHSTEKQYRCHVKYILNFSSLVLYYEEFWHKKNLFLKNSLAPAAWKLIYSSLKSQSTECNIVLVISTSSNCDVTNRQLRLQMRSKEKERMNTSENKILQKCLVIKNKG